VLGKKNPALWVFLAFAMLLAAALGPAVPLLWAESKLSRAMQTWAGETDVQGLTEPQLRSRVQSLAREQGLHLEFSDIVVQYRDTKGEGLVQLPREVGYTLSLELPLFGVWFWNVVAVRLHPFRGAPGS
jgi:hypothetical protein